jgi:signal transduction histidine kinase
VAVAAIPLGAVMAGTLVAANQMFVSSHDLESLFVVMISASTAGTLGALVLGHELASARRDLETARDRERFVEQGRRDLVAWVSHDLRTPLAGMRAMVEALQDGVVDDEPTMRRYHAQILAEIGWLTRLVNDLFELARIHADAVPPTRDRVSLGDIVSDAVASVAARAESEGVVVSPRLRADPHVRVPDRELIRVMQNLIDNAVRHTPAGGEVVVDVDAADGIAVVSVLDGCGGIDEREMLRVFDLAYSGNAARTPGGGTGLGLAIARGLVETHAGEIDVVNDNGGCRFTVRLPRA